MLFKNTRAKRCNLDHYSKSPKDSYPLQHAQDAQDTKKHQVHAV